jgi:hypothetical protein
MNTAEKIIGLGIQIPKLVTSKSTCGIHGLMRESEHDYSALVPFDDEEDISPPRKGRKCRSALTRATKRFALSLALCLILVYLTLLWVGQTSSYSKPSERFFFVLYYSRIAF